VPHKLSKEFIVDMATRMENATGADIANRCREAALKKIRENRTEIKMEELYIEEQDLQS